MHTGRRIDERTSLTRPLDSPDYVEFASLLRTRKIRVRQFQCCICATLIAIFTMALIVTVSYSVSHDIIDVPPNLTPETTTSGLNLTRPLKLGFVPGTGSYTLFSNPSIVHSSNSILMSGKSGAIPVLTEDEIKEGLEAGRQAVNDRLSADATALISPVSSPSPESRHRYAVSTCASVGTLALAAVAEIAATRWIENSRAILGIPSAVGSFFDGSSGALGACKQLITPECPSSRYRSFDGSCNRPMQRGASMTPFRRVLPPSYADGVEAPRRAISGSELPSAREVSLKVHKPSPSSNPRFTVMLAVYGQFLDHDITATAISQGINGSSISCCPSAVDHPECFPVPVSAGDPVFDVTGRTCMNFVRSAPAPQCKLGPREQLNQVTAFIDASVVYGSDVGTADSLREFAGGRLRMQRTPDNRTLLPPSTNPNDGCNRETERLRGRYCFAAGDARANENLHLTTMHLLWARQHNRIAEKLAEINPAWDDETLYQESRRIVGAQLQHITYSEFLPIILGERETDLRNLRPLESGYRLWIDDPNDPGTDPTIANHFAAAAFRFAHTLLPGLMRVTDLRQGTSAYVELHRMLFNPYSLYAEDGVKSSVTTATRNTIQMTSTHVTSQLTNHLFEDPIGNVTVPCGLDLVSLNIQRGRDHGLPGYTKWREHCGRGKVESFSDLVGHMDPQALQEISMLYESVHDVDLYTGALAEFPVAGSIVGPTFACLIADQFARLHRGDRFWYEVAGQPHSFTEDQLTELRKTSLARLICDCSDGVMQTQAQVMRSIGPENPMMSCEDLPALSLEPWKENVMGPTLRASYAPVNWTELKNNINDTIKDVVSYINNTRSSVSLDTDWLAFKNYINNTFADLRNQLSDRYPSNSTADSPPREKASTYPDSFILRAAGPASVYEDWIAFKNNVVKSLNDSIGTMGSGPAATAKWIAYKQNIIDQFSDLKDQISSMKADVASKLQQQPSTITDKSVDPQKTKIVPIAAIFDWKNFKDNIVSSLNDTITEVSNNMPPPGDPAWATYGNEIKDRFVEFKGKVDNSKTTEVPVELATQKASSVDDWLTYKTEIIKTVNDAVNKIKNEMPPPGDPAWSTYRDQIVNSFSAFKSTPPPMEFATLSTLAQSSIVEGEKLKATSVGEFGDSKLSNLTSDWLEFRSSINDSLTRAIQDIQSKKPTTADPVGWSAFRESIVNDFAKLKDEVATKRAEWLAELAKPRENETAPSLRATFKPSGNVSKFDYTRFIKPVIPPDEWVDFKKQINDTVMNILSTANSTDKMNLDELHEMFNESFADLKSEISSLKALIADTYNNKTAADWIRFQTQLNATVDDFVSNMKGEGQLASGNLMRVLFETKRRMSDLEPPMNSSAVPPAQWVRYAMKVNETISDTLKTVDPRKYTSSMLRAEEPLSSGIGPVGFNGCLILLCLAASLRGFALTSRFYA